VAGQISILREVHSPHIVEFHGHYTWKKNLYIFMELSEWGSVQDMVCFEFVDYYIFLTKNANIDRFVNKT
jgi:serine/threonine protein kinase